MTKGLPWSRLAAEGAVIVVSILLAFAVDAWWDRAQETAASRVALAGLTEDFRANQAAAGRIRAQLQSFSQAFHVFRDLPLERIARLQEDPDSAQFYFAVLWGATSFDSQQGTLDALVSSGNLERVPDAALRAKLLRWTALMEDSREEVLYMKNGGNEVTRRAAALGGPWEMGFGEDPNWPQADLVAMHQDEELMAAAANTRFWCDIYLLELVRLEALAGEIVADLEALQ